jgi:hypothetical protein
MSDPNEKSSNIAETDQISSAFGICCVLGVAAFYVYMPWEASRRIAAFEESYAQSWSPDRTQEIASDPTQIVALVEAKAYCKANRRGPLETIDECQVVDRIFEDVLKLVPGKRLSLLSEHTAHEEIAAPPAAGPCIADTCDAQEAQGGQPGKMSSQWAVQ